jgi:hypothetical protein
MPPHDREFDPTTNAEFDTLVKQLLTAAHENHVDAAFGIDVRHPSTDVPDWTVEITRIEKRRDG